MDYHSILVFKNLQIPLTSPELKTFPSKHFGSAQNHSLNWNFTFGRKSVDSDECQGRTDVKVNRMEADGMWILEQLSQRLMSILESF